MSKFVEVTDLHYATSKIVLNINSIERLCKSDEGDGSVIFLAGRNGQDSKLYVSESVEDLREKLGVA